MGKQGLEDPALKLRSTLLERTSDVSKAIQKLSNIKNRTAARSRALHKEVDLNRARLERVYAVLAQCPSLDPQGPLPAPIS